MDIKASGFINYSCFVYRQFNILSTVAVKASGLNVRNCDESEEES